MEKIQEALVKGVLSGDTVILSGKMKKNSEEAPEEKNLYLSLVSAPRSANSNNLDEEPFGWDSRDFLRERVLGKVVKYTVDYQNNDKLYGQIYLEGKNINVEIVKNGFAKVGFIQKNNESMAKGEYYSKLQTAEAEAKKNKLNIWLGDPATTALHKRKLYSVCSHESDAEISDVIKYCKDKEVDVMVDYVINCAMYIVFVKEINTFIKMNMRFIAIPNSKDAALYKGGRAYVERLILHKDIKALIFTADDNKSFLGDLIDKKGPISSFIIKNGYSKLFISNSIPYTTTEINLMKDAQKQAKKDKLRLWKNHKDEEENEEGNDKGFLVGKEVKGKSNCKTLTDIEGVVFQIHSGDSLSVKNSTTGEVIRIFLSHLKAPKLAKPLTEEQDQPWAWQAKEYLRNSLVGSKVRCEFDYSKTLEKDAKKMNFYSVFRFVSGKENNKKDKNSLTDLTSTKEKNVNVELIELGYASFVSPRIEDDVSKYLDSYQIAEKTAKEKKVGIHSIKSPGNPNYADLIAGNKTKKKETINFLVNQRNLSCVVEYCFSGSKFKLRIDKNKSYVPFSLLGIKTFSKDKNNLDIHEQFFNEALNFANDTILQRDGTCDVISADRVGNYFGYLTINNTNFATTLLREGLAVVNTQQTTTPIIHLNEFKNAEKVAEQSKKNIWSHSNLASFLKEGELVSTLSNKFEEKHTEVKLRITDYIDFNNFFINLLPNKTLDKIENVLMNYETGASKPVSIEFPVKLGTLCAARYQNDYHFYRAKILRGVKDDKYEVEFLDYGTVDVCSKEDLIKLDSSIAMIEPQSQLCELAYLKYSQNSMKKALETITDFVNLDVQLCGKISYTYNKDGKSKAGVVIYQTADKKLENTYHNDLLKLGFAKFDPRKAIPEYLQDLKVIEKKADQLGIGLWAENETADYDEEEEEEV